MKWKLLALILFGVIMTYNIYPAVDQTYNFPPEVRAAAAVTNEMKDQYAPITHATTKAEADVVDAHIGNLNNPHGVTKAQLGLGNVNNTTDMGKPVSTLQKAYIDGLVGKSWAGLGSKIAFIGDSYMSGYGLVAPATDRWPKVLATMAGAAENNLAVASSGYINQGDGGNSKFSNQALLISADVTHVIISGGINDAPLGTSAAAIQAEVVKTIDNARSIVPNVPITIISPMWSASAPSDALLIVESQIRGAIPSSVNYIERGPWLRVDRPEWEQADGHPNILGAKAIASWVRDQMGGTLIGSEFISSVVPGTSDLVINTTNFPGYVMRSATVRGAKSGWWVLEAQVVMYTTSNGFLWIKENNRKVSLRSDATSNPLPHRHRIRFYHPGGDLPISFGFDPSAGTPSLITNGQSFLKATYDGVK